MLTTLAKPLCYTSSNEFRIQEDRMLFALYLYGTRLCVFWCDAIAELK